ncbi:shikimate kinase [Clostridium sardiniense]|uniref:shikimate kinase n=1 Tax=Clostridium sardiniense TaxID=29369 RepID=UPI00195F0687|nr:shikimate kinase [Clostridium sardiniense]MBM7836114.1 shikimate kinase [Clostridium sardiniense]
MEKRDKIVIIGMPGCGKTTIGKILAKELNYNFYDMDQYIEETHGKSIKEIFAKSENDFRDLETKACKELILKKRCVISTGGGVIKRGINIDILGEYGIILFINRPIEKIVGDIDISSRPLLKEGKEKLYKLYEERFYKYKEAAHVEVINEGFLRDTINLAKFKLKGKIKE